MHHLFSKHVIQLGEQPTIRPALLSIENGHISAIDWSVQHFTEARLRVDGVLTDASPYLVTPSFVNGHSHLAMCAFRGLSVEAMDGNIVEDLYFRLETLLTAEDVRAFTRMGAYESLLSGVGSVWDHYYHADAVAQGLADVGLTGIVAPTLQDLNGPGCRSLDAQLQATTNILEDARLAKAGIGAAYGPHATDTVSDDLWRRIAHLAEEQGTFIHTHVAQSIEEYHRNIETHGATPIERLDGLGVLDAGAGTLLVHSLFVTENDLARLRPHRNVLGYCPYSQVQFCFPAEAEAWSNAGLPIVVGTDCGACNDTMNVQQELRLLSLGPSFTVTHSQVGQAFRGDGRLDRAQALDTQRRRLRQDRFDFSQPAHVLDMVWSIPGQMDPRLNVGRLEVGARANLCLWDLDHPACWPANDPWRTLVMADMASAIWGVMLNGQWMGTPGDYRRSILDSATYLDARGEAQARLRGLYGQLGLSTPLTA